MKAFLAVTYDSERAPLTPEFFVPDSVRELADVHLFDSRALEVPEIRHAVANNKDMSYYYRGHVNRERMLKEFMATDRETLISLDGDTIIGDDFVELINLDVPVRWAPYPFREHFSDGYVFLGGDKPSLTGFVTFGALGIQRMVLKSMCPPYVLNPDYLSDDFNFSRRLMNHGIIPWMLQNIKVGHQDRKTGRIYYFNEEGRVVG
jgi:hypothetical protein